MAEEGLAAAAAARAPLEFGWVPAEAVRSLVEEVGNFRARGVAIEQLHAAVLDVGVAVDVAAVRATLSAFLSFLLHLVADHNFRIAASSMAILEDLAQRLGADLQPYLGSIAVPVIERLGDSVAAVRAAAARAVLALAGALGPAPVLEALGGALVHPHWRTREEGVNAYTAALLAFPQASFDYPGAVRALAAATADDSRRVAAAALEALALLHARLGNLLQGLLSAVGASEEAKRAVAERVRATPQLGLPVLDVRGLVAHQAHARPPSAVQQPMTAAAQTPATNAAGAPASAHQFTIAASPLEVQSLNPLPSPQAAALPAASYAAPAASEVEASAVSYASVSSTGRSSMAAAEVDGEQQQSAERSGGSLLGWVLPTRRPAQQSFTAGASRRPSRPSAGTHVAAASVLASAGSRDGSVRGLARSPKLMSQPSVQRPQPTGVAASAALPVLSHATSDASAAGADLFGSVRNWQQQRGGGAECEGSAPPGLASQEGGAVVEARSDSLLQWHLPPRAASHSRKAAAGSQRQQQPAAAVPPAPAAPPVPAAVAPGVPAPSALQRIGSASLRRTLSSFKKRVFGADGAGVAGGEQGQWKAAQAEGVLQQQPGSPGWLIPAVHDLAPSPADAAGSTGSTLPARASKQEEQPESPNLAGDRMNRLKRLSERRRVSSAPFGAFPLLAADGPEQQQPQGTVAGSDDCSGAHSPGVIGGERCVEESVPEARPGLQALKARARTARSSSASAPSGTLLAAAGGGGPSSQYSMAAVDDVFGPDRPVRSLSSWSPLKAGTASESSDGGSPPKTAILRSNTVPPALWPGSPASGSSSPARSSWHAPDQCPGAMSAAGSPQTPAWTAADGGTPTAFSPTAAESGPLTQPEAALQQVLGSLQRAAQSGIKEVDWQAQYQALSTARRLAQHHHTTLAPPLALKAFVAVTAPVMDALRSTLSRLAIAIFVELVQGLGPALDAELESFVPLLLKRAGQISIAGRDNFLAVEADQALAAVVERAGEAKVAAVLLGCLTSCKAADMRAKAAMHLDACVQLHGACLVRQSPALVPRLLRAAVGLLDEGRLEARSAGKRMLWELRRQMEGRVGAPADDFKKALARLDCKTDKVWDVFEAAAMPALPLTRATSASLRCTTAGCAACPAWPATGSSSPARQSILTGHGSGPPDAAWGSSNPGSSGSSRTNSAAVTASPAQAGIRPGSTAGRGSSGTTPGIYGAGSASYGGGAAGRRGASRPSSGRSVGSAAGGGGFEGGAAGGPVPSGSLAGVAPELQQQLEAAEPLLGSMEWKQRLQGLQVLQAARGLPPEAQLWVAARLAQHVVDANLKVQQQALLCLNQALEAGAPSLAPAAGGLVPALCKCIDSGNPLVRQQAGLALDAAERCWDAAALVPPLCAALGAASGGGVRGTSAVLGRLAALAPSLCTTRPALVRRQALPTLLALLAVERRPELRQLVVGALAVLAKLMGGELTAAAAAAGLGPAKQQVVARLVEEARSGGSGSVAGLH